jgi:hypothetical protein
MWRSLLVLALATAVAGCSKSAGPNDVAKTKLAPAAAADQAATNPSPSAPQIAYTYSFAFKLPAAYIVAAQAQHVALCDRLGPKCHVVSMDQEAGPRSSAGADMEFAVAADAARSFGDALIESVAHEGGETTGRTIQGEDLSKQIVDVEAQLRGRQALADRLLQIVQTHQGTIADLTAAEKSLADVQQEIDTARAELAEAQGRVAMSTVRISYAGSAGLGGFSAPISDSFASMGSIAGMSLAALITLLAVVLPWLLPIAALIVAYRWWHKRGVSEGE